MPYIPVILKRFLCAKDLPRYAELDCRRHGTSTRNPSSMGRGASTGRRSPTHSGRSFAQRMRFRMTGSKTFHEVRRKSHTTRGLTEERTHTTFPLSCCSAAGRGWRCRSEEHTSELRHPSISYAV